MRPTPEQLEKLVQAYYAAAQDRSVSAIKRLKFRMEAKRGRALLAWHRKLATERADGQTEA